MLYLLIFILGLAKNLAFPCFNFWCILFIVFPLLYLIGYVFALSLWQRLSLGFVFGFAFVLGGFYWVYNAIYISTLSSFLAILATLGMAIAIGSFYSFLFISKDLFKNKGHSFHIIAMLLTYTVITYLKTAIVPWYHIPVVFSHNTTFIQFLRFTNIHVANFVLSAVFLTPLLFYFCKKVKHTLLVCLVIVLPLSVIYVDGLNYINKSKTQDSYSKKDFIVKIVQVNANQFEKTRGINVSQRYKETMSLVFKGLSKIKESEKTVLIVLPESAFDGILNNNHYAVKFLSSHLKSNQYVIAGGLRRDNDNKIYNSLFVIGKGGILSFYDKHHLVPVGEYIPFVSSSVVGNYGFTKGDGYKNLNVNSINILPLICFEIGFLGNSNIYNNTDLIVNITNDAWYGNTTQPYHHLALASLHAISSGKNIIRVSNNGISALLNKNGKVIFQTSLYSKNSVIIKLSI